MKKILTLFKFFTFSVFFICSTFCYAASSNMYVRGEFTGWGEGEGKEMVLNENIWTTTIYLNNGIRDFKFANTNDAPVNGHWPGDDWGRWFGYDSGGNEKSLSGSLVKRLKENTTTDVNEDIRINIDNAGYYLFTFNENDLSFSISNVWLGRSFIIFNGDTNWYTASGASDTYEAFNDKDFGAIGDSFTLNGQVDVYPYCNSCANPPRMYYRFDNNDDTKSSIVLNYQKSSVEKSANSEHKANNAITISNLSNGEHFIEVWFEYDGAYDNNSGSNYKASFTIEQQENFSVTAPPGTSNCYIKTSTSSYLEMNPVAGSSNVFSKSISSTDLGSSYTYNYYTKDGSDNFYKEIGISNDINAGRTYNTGNDIIECWEVPGTATPTPQSGPITVRFKFEDGITDWVNSVENNSPKIYGWEGGILDGSSLKAWPGVYIGSADADGWYSYTFPDGVSGFNFVINNNASPQTVDIKDITGDCWIVVLNEKDNGKYKYSYFNPEASIFKWKSNTTSTEWNNSANWTVGGQAATRYPGINKDDVVIIPANTNNKYPEVPVGKAIKAILFEPGAEIARQDLLNYNRAFVQYDFRSAASRGRWHMLSMPLQEAYSGDFTFGGYPFAYVRKFVTEEIGGVTYAGWVPNKGNDTKFGAGSGFALWVAAGGTGLSAADDIIELPFFDSNRVLNDYVRYTHEYTSGTSKFYNFKKEGNDYVRSDNFVNVTRNQNTNAAYKLAGQTVTETLEFGEDDDYSTTSKFALAGNPFMTTIDFTKLVDANSSVISSNYLVWNESAFLGYTGDGSYGVGVTNSSGLTKNIAPLQSFIVESSQSNNNPAVSNSLSFNIATLSVDESSNSVTGQGTLKSTTATADKIEIVASNPTASVLTFIANREYGENILCDRDGRKLLSGLNEIPEIYTLKETETGEKTAVGANIINTDGNSIQVPIGLATTHNGEMSLSFSGMADYDANIYLQDMKADDGIKTINLTGETEYTYTFNYTPPTDANKATEIIPDNDRFILSFSPKSITGIENSENNSGEEVLVYFSNNTVYAVSSPDNLIQQLYIYDMQGRLLYAIDNIQASAYAATDILLPSDVCIAKLTTEKGVKSIKLVIR